jgi:valyl-tRNA synthetase
VRQVVQRSTAAHERLEMAEAGRLLYDFVWGDFADWYIEVRAQLDRTDASMTHLELTPHVSQACLLRAWACHRHASPDPYMDGRCALVVATICP